MSPRVATTSGGVIRFVVITSVAVLLSSSLWLLSFGPALLCFILLMASIFLESAAVFKAKVQAEGLSSVYDTFVSLGWNTLGKFACAVSYIPGSPDDTKFVEKIIMLSLDHDFACSSCARLACEKTCSLHP